MTYQPIAIVRKHNMLNLTSKPPSLAWPWESTEQQRWARVEWVSIVKPAANGQDRDLTSNYFARFMNN